MFRKHPMSKNTCRGDRPLAPTSLETYKTSFWGRYIGLPLQCW